MLETVRISLDSMVDGILGNIIEELSKRGTFGGFSKERVQLLLGGIWNNVYYTLKDSQNLAGRLEECSDSTVMQSVWNGSTF